jgi:hypothetical protein
MLTHLFSNKYFYFEIKQLRHSGMLTPPEKIPLSNFCNFIPACCPILQAIIVRSFLMSFALKK